MHPPTHCNVNYTEDPKKKKRNGGSPSSLLYFSYLSLHPQSRHQADIYHRPPLRGLKLEVLKWKTASSVCAL